jgi:hypothetical protein
MSSSICSTVARTWASFSCLTPDGRPVFKALITRGAPSADGEWVWRRPDALGAASAGASSNFVSTSLNGERSIIKRQCLDKKSLILLKSEDFLFLGALILFIV